MLWVKSLSILMGLLAVSLAYLGVLDSRNILTINLVLWALIGWHYRMKPRLAKRRLNRQLKSDPHFKLAKKTEQFINRLYQRNEAYALSRKACKTLGPDQGDFTYGEIDVLAFYALLKEVDPKPHDIFYDLGCGSGKAVLTAALSFNLTKACGVELLPELATLANTQLNKAREEAAHRTRLACVQFYTADFLKHDFMEATILFINATCISEENWNALLKKIKCLKAGTRIILTSRKIQDDRFKVVFDRKELMSWGMNSVTIYACH